MNSKRKRDADVTVEAMGEASKKSCNAASTSNGPNQPIAPKEMSRSRGAGTRGGSRSRVLKGRGAKHAIPIGTFVEHVRASGNTVLLQEYSLLRGHLIQRGVLDPITDQPKPCGSRSRVPVLSSKGPPSQPKAKAGEKGSTRTYSDVAAVKTQKVAKQTLGTADQASKPAITATRKGRPVRPAGLTARSSSFWAKFEKLQIARENVASVKKSLTNLRKFHSLPSNFIVE